MRLEPSLHRVGSDLVSFYLVGDERGVTMIDAGLPGHWNELVDELGAMGRTTEHIQGVILTHGDTDHLGVAERVRRDHRATVYVHSADAAQARGEVAKKNPPWGERRLGPLLSFLWYAGRRGGMRVAPVSEVTSLTGGETLNLPGNPRIIHIPGHSPGSVAIHVPSVGALFVGDALTTRHVLTGVEGPQPAPFTLDPDRAIESLRILDDLEARWVLPGHGPPWKGSIQEATELTRAFAGASGSPL